MRVRACVHWRAHLLLFVPAFTRARAPLCMHTCEGVYGRKTRGVMVTVGAY